MLKSIKVPLIDLFVPPVTGRDDFALAGWYDEDDDDEAVEAYLAEEYAVSYLGVQRELELAREHEARGGGI